MNFLKIRDSLTSLLSSMMNRRNAVASNRFRHDLLDFETMRAIYKSGLGSKIVRIKGGYSLDDTIQFDSRSDLDTFNQRLLPHVKKAVKFMIAFGRGVIVIYEDGADLSKPRSGPVDLAKAKIRAFSGDMVVVTQYNTDLGSVDYYKPQMYTIQGRSFHKSRIIDFTYVEPVDLEKPLYRFGGISEFEMIYPQIINDGVVERASAGILDKASRKYIKVDGFKNALSSGNAGEMLSYFSAMEDATDLFGASVIDSNDEVVVINQTLSNLSESDTITLRRIAMVSSIPLPVLIGEAVRGLNSSGEQERLAFQDMIETLQSDYILDPLQQLCYRVGLGVPSFKENQGGTQNERAEYDGKILDNAMKLYELGLDYDAYLTERGLKKNEDDLADLLSKFATVDEPEPIEPIEPVQ